MEWNVARNPLICSNCSDDIYAGEDYLKTYDDEGQSSAICGSCAEHVEHKWSTSKEQAEANGEEYDEEDYETMPDGWVGLDFGD